MARGDSIIRVSIIGDASKLLGAVKDADRATGGLLKSTAKVAAVSLVGLGVIDKAFETVGAGLEKADTFHDALDRISGTVSPEFAKRIKDVAFDMSDMGLSADEVGNLAANFADLATAAKVTEPAITTATPKLLELAAAVAATQGKTVDEVVTDIGKAIKGSQKPVEEYGIVINKALSPDEQLTSILDQLATKFPDVKAATDDLAGSQETLGAKWDNFTILLGEALEGPLKGVVDWMTDILEMIPGAIEGWQMLGAGVEDFGRMALGPLGNVRDALEGLLGLIGRVGDALGANGPAPGNLGSFEADVIAANRRASERNGLSGHMGR